MDVERERQIIALSRQAAGMADSERVRFLDQLTADDPVLGREVLAMLELMAPQDQGTLQNVVDKAAIGFDTATFGRDETQSVEEDPPKLRGFTVHSKIGQGGMGSVYLATQTEPERLVAIKIINAKIIGQSAEVRFRMEQQALARLNHPGIAALYETGTTEDGQPYFVMEYLEGMTLLEFVDSRRLSIPCRLRLFEKICNAVQHAHQKGILHRDLKPDNLIVVDLDGDPLPKVIDFGISKAVDPMMGQAAATCTKLIGTPAYMSPEALQLVPDADIDIRSDVYALGVILFQLITGLHPLQHPDDLGQLAGELQKDIRPSSRFTGVTSDEQKKIRELRQIEARAFSRILRKDLDWIVVRARHTDLEKRYASVSELAADIRCYLNNEPVSAGPPSFVYRAQKFVQRNKLAVVAAGLLWFTLLGGIVGTSIGFLNAKAEAARAATAESKAKIEAENAQETVQLLHQFLSSVRPSEKGKDLKVIDLLHAFEPRMSDLVDRPFLQGSLYHTYGVTYRGLGLYDEALSFHTKAYQTRLESLGNASPRYPPFFE